MCCILCTLFIIRCEYWISFWPHAGEIFGELATATHGRLSGVYCSEMLVGNFWNIRGFYLWLVRAFQKLYPFPSSGARVHVWRSHRTAIGSCLTPSLSSSSVQVHAMLCNAKFWQKSCESPSCPLARPFSKAIFPNCVPPEAESARHLYRQRRLRANWYCVELLPI